MTNIDLSKLLEQLFLELKKCQSPLAEVYQPGIDEIEIDKLIKPYHLDFPEELTTLFSWKNGFAVENGEDYPLSAFTLFSLASPISITESLEIYKSYSIKRRYWDSNFFPIFESGLGDFFLFDIGKSSPTYKMIMFYSPGTPYFEGVVSYSDSMGKLIETTINCYQKKIFYFGEFEGHKVFEMQALLHFQVWKSNNPKSEYWKILEKS